MTPPILRPWYSFARPDGEPETGPASGYCWSCAVGRYVKTSNVPVKIEQPDPVALCCVCGKPVRDRMSEAVNGVLDRVVAVFDGQGERTP